MSADDHNNLEMGYKVGPEVDIWVFHVLPHLLHRDNGPAMISADGTKAWYQYGKIHRGDGPAVEYVNGDLEWWVRGREYDFLTWLEEILPNDKTGKKVMLKLKYG